MSATTVVDTLIDYVRRRDHCSFVEILGCLEEQGVPTQGTLSMELGPNVLLWAGLSEEAYDILDDPRCRAAIVPVGASVLVYAFDGGILDLPIAKRPPKSGYKKPHWLPVVFRTRERAGWDPIKEGP
ncbi:MAG TPA: hypothetical protein VGF51_12255 [Acidimicrobiales bacterium]|jgi:hypothetical protein